MHAVQAGHLLGLGAPPRNVRDSLASEAAALLYRKAAQNISTSAIPPNPINNNCGDKEKRGNNVVACQTSQSVTECNLGASTGIGSAELGRELMRLPDETVSGSRMMMRSTLGTQVSRRAKCSTSGK